MSTERDAAEIVLIKTLKVAPKTIVGDLVRHMDVIRKLINRKQSSVARCPQMRQGGSCDCAW